MMRLYGDCNAALQSMNTEFFEYRLKENGPKLGSLFSHCGLLPLLLAKVLLLLLLLQLLLLLLFYYYYNNIICIFSESASSEVYSSVGPGIYRLYLHGDFTVSNKDTSDDTVKSPERKRKGKFIGFVANRNIPTFL
jgi:hypothetical protein